MVLGMGQSLMMEVLRGNADPLSADLVPQVLDAILEQLGFLRRDLKIGCSKGRQDLAKDPEVSPSVSGVDRGIIQVTEDLGLLKMA